jgi:hypothetical protein
MTPVPKEHFIVVVDDLVCQSVVVADFWNVVFLLHLDVEASLPFLLQCLTHLFALTKSIVVKSNQLYACQLRVSQSDKVIPFHSLPSGQIARFETG